MVHDRDPGRAGGRFTAMAPFLRRLSEGADRVDADDVTALRSAGLDDEEILEAAHVAVLLEICNRVVNALGVEPMGPVANRRAATFLLRRGGAFRVVGVGRGVPRWNPSGPAGPISW